MAANVKSMTMGHQWSSKVFGEGSYPYIVMASAMTFWTMVSIIPVYNKFFFKKSLYPYPIASAGIQLSIVSILLSIVSSLRHCWFRFYHPNKCTNDEYSWIFGPHLLWKLKWASLPGVLFGMKYGITNFGLYLLPAPAHLLLQSTDIVWTLLAAWLINKERVSIFEFFCLIVCVAGCVMQSIHVGETIEAPIFALCVNFLSPIFLALCVSTLRLACTELMRHDNRVSGSLTSVELSALKLAMSAATSLTTACIMEPNWSVAFMSLAKSTKLGVLFGSIPILIFQVNCTFLAFLTSAVVVGLAGQVKIIPQWATAALFSRNFHLGLWNGLGALLIITSASAFAFHNFRSYSRNSLAFVWNISCRNADEVEGLLSISVRSGSCRDTDEAEGLLSISNEEKPSYSSTDEESSEEEIEI